ncbi:MAG: S9 family peptidase [Bacteroidales bacterium]|nr:S9 family peptidase [Bacteroidales bacterium]
MKKSIICLLAIVGLGYMAIAQKNITLEDIWLNGTFSAKGISEIRSMKDGEHYCILTRKGIEQYAYKTGEKVKDVCLFNTPGQKEKVKPMPIIQSYTFDNNEKQILLSCEFEPIYRHSGVSNYYIYDIEKNTFEMISQNGKQRLTTFSPDGTMVAFVRDNNIYIIDLQTKEEKQITFDGKINSIINGTTDWVYEEEFGITQGFYWSPDSKKIAFYRFDESMVKEYTMQMWGELYPNNYKFKYPKAGEKNSTVDVLIYDLPTQKITKLDIGSENDQYIPRIKWTTDANSLAIMRMNRWQNEMEILLANATNGQLSTIYTEKDSSYIDVPDVWNFLSDGKNFLITSEKDGYNHIYLCSISGNTVKQVTTGNYDVVKINGIDEKNKKIYYTSKESSPINSDLYVINFDGKKKTKLSDKLGTYSASFSNGCKYYISNFTDANTPPIYSIHNAKGKELVMLQNNSDLEHKMKEFGNEEKEFGTFKTSENVELNYYMVKPANFDSTKRHPIFFYVYGGPGSQQVVNRYGGSDYYWHRMLAQKGYVVICIDGRGTGGRGSNFKKVTYKELGKYECVDVIEAAKYFGKQPWADESRIGIFGWSFGGYLSSLAILKGNDVFKTAIAVAPVTTWRYYNTIYTERFLRRPQENAQGYDENSPINFANNLKGNYLIIHGTGDDNVHFQNALDMISALQKEGKEFDMHIYPNKNHSIYGGNTRWHLYSLMTKFIEENL